MICDTCGRETPTVSRVVIDKDYNRANARPIYNCPECFEKKNQERGADKDENVPSETAPSASS